MKNGQTNKVHIVTLKSLEVQHTTKYLHMTVKTQSIFCYWYVHSKGPLNTRGPILYLVFASQDISQLFCYSTWTDLKSSKKKTFLVVLISMKLMLRQCTTHKYEMTNFFRWRYGKDPVENSWVAGMPVDIGTWGLEFLQPHSVTCRA